MNDRTQPKNSETQGFYTTTGREVPMVTRPRGKPAPWLALPTPDLDAAAARFPSGDRKAFGELFHASHGKIQAAIARQVGNDADAQDVLSLVYTAAWMNRETFSGDYGGFVAWLLALVRGQAANWRHGVARRQRLGVPDGCEHDPAVAPAVESDDWVTADRMAFIQEHIATLMPALRLVVERHLAGWTFAEMARVAGTDERRMRTLWARAVQRIQDAVAADKRVPKGIVPAPAPAWWWFDQLMEVVANGV